MSALENTVRAPRPSPLSLIVLTMVVVVVVVLSSSLLLFSFMAFDAGETPSTWVVFIAIWMTPVVMILGLAVAWIGYAARSRLVTRIGVGACFVPLIPLGVLACIALVNMLAF